MYPSEITSTPLWVRHALPLFPPPPPDGDENLRKQIRFEHIDATNEMIEHYVKQERARLDLKWCLNEFFGWSLSHPFVGRLVTANIFGHVHLAHIICLNPVNVVVAPVDILGNSMMIGYDDIYSADSPILEKYLLSHRLLHSQHVLDYIANQKRKDALIESGHDISFNTTLFEPIGEYFEAEWPAGHETWFIHDELPQRKQFISSEQQMRSETSISNFTETSLRKKSSTFNSTSELIVQHSNEIMSLMKPDMTKHRTLRKRKKLFNDKGAKQNVIIDLSPKCNSYDIKIHSLNSTAIASKHASRPNVALLVSSGILFIFILMICRNVLSYLLYYGGRINILCLFKNMNLHSINNFYWFRTLTVP